MKEKLYRDEMVEKLSTPESLNEYMKVIRFYVWPLVITFLLVVISLYFWISSRNDAVFIKTAGAASGGEFVCYVLEDDINDLRMYTDDFTVAILDNGSVLETVDKNVIIADVPVLLDDDKFDPYMLHLGDLYAYDWAYPVSCPTTITDGVYEVSIYNHSGTLFD